MDRDRDSYGDGDSDRDRDRDSVKSNIAYYLIRLFRSDYAAAKVAGNELRGLISYFNCPNNILEGNPNPKLRRFPSPLNHLTLNPLTP
jgi:hypothetical protein